MAKLKRKSRHSPAGKKWLGGKSVKGKLKEERLKRTRPVYYRRGESYEVQLRKKKVAEADIKKMIGAKNYVGP